MAALHLIQPLINVLLWMGTYANRWKVAKVIPLLKYNDLNKLCPSSYRPVVILPTVSKLVEQAAQSQLLDFRNTTKQLNPSLQSYRTGYNTTTTPIEVTNRLYEASDRREMTSIMTVDQSAAFDCVENHILLDILKKGGLGVPKVRL